MPTSIIIIDLFLTIYACTCIQNVLSDIIGYEVMTDYGFYNCFYTHGLLTLLSKVNSGLIKCL